MTRFRLIFATGPGYFFVVVSGRDMVSPRNTERNVRSCYFVHISSITHYFMSVTLTLDPSFRLNFMCRFE